MSYRVREIFDTLQGEGARAGTRAVFLRLSGCNLWNGLPAGRGKGQGACAAWCDTDFFDGAKTEAPAIADELDKLWARERGDERWVVITGGEPCLQLDQQLLGVLKGRGWCVAVETNGTLDPGGGRVLDMVDHLCVSPKVNRLATPLRRRRAHELKVVVPGAGLGMPGWTETSIRELERSGRWEQVFIQPQDGPARRDAEAFAVELVRRNPRWRLSVQTHKSLGLP